MENSAKTGDTKLRIKGNKVVFHLTEEQKNKIRIGRPHTGAWIETKINGFESSEYEACQSRASKGSNALGKCRDFTQSILGCKDNEKVQT